MALRTHRKQRNIYLQKFPKATLVSHNTLPPYLQPPPPAQHDRTVFSEMAAKNTELPHPQAPRLRAHIRSRRGWRPPQLDGAGTIPGRQSQENNDILYQALIRFKVTYRPNIKGLNYAHRIRKN